MMRKFSYEISFLVTLLARDEEDAFKGLEHKFPKNNGRVTFANIDGDEIYFTLFDVKGIGEEEWR